ncbi:MAG: hypothetical protein ACYDCK_08295 [Thermoplasmatota archaeon]
MTRAGARAGARAKAAWRERLDAETLTRRASWCAVIALGLTVVVMRSIITQSVGAIPYKFLPDVRAPVAFLVAFAFAASAAFGDAARRKPLLAFVALTIVAFTLEVSTVHWFTDIPGSITGSRIDPLAAGGALVALAGVALLHAEVESFALARDLRQRGAPELAAASADAGDFRAALARSAVQRVAAPFGVAAALAGVAALADLAIRDHEIGPAPVALAVGAALVLVAAGFAWRAVRSPRVG